MTLPASAGPFLNFTVVTVADGRAEQRSFSRFAEAGALRSSVGERAEAWPARPGEPAEPLDIRIGEDAPRVVGGGDRPLAASLTSYAECYEDYKLLERSVAPTVIGEFHTEGDTHNDSYFHYGQSADTDVSVGVKYPGQGWSLSGEHHVGNKVEQMVGKEDPGRNFHAQLLTDFVYGRYEVTSNCGKHQKIRPMQWLGGSTERFYPAPGCNPDDPWKTRRYDGGHVFTRNVNRAERWGGAAEVFGVSLAAQSGYSRWVQAHWKFGNEVEAHYLCGNNSNPKEATRILAGVGVPQAECRPGKPC